MTMTKENRAALQSVRAKARKALNVPEADLPKTVTAHLEAVVKWTDSALKPEPNAVKSAATDKATPSTKRAPVKKAA